MADLIDETRENKPQWFEQNDGIQFHRFFEAQRFLVRIQWPCGCATRARVQPDAVLAKTFGYFYRRQCGKISECVKAPSTHGFEKRFFRG